MLLFQIVPGGPKQAAEDPWLHQAQQADRVKVCLDIIAVCSQPLPLFSLCFAQLFPYICTHICILPLAQDLNPEKGQLLLPGPSVLAFPPGEEPVGVLPRLFHLGCHYRLQPPESCLEQGHQHLCLLTLHGCSRGHLKDHLGTCPLLISISTSQHEVETLILS